MSSRSVVCPHCRFGVKYEMEFDIRDRIYNYKAYCHCVYAYVPVTESQVNDKLFDESYAYELAWQRWKEEVDKKSMTKVSGPANEENPGSEEETGAIDSDAVWDAVIRAMLLSYYKGITYANHGDLSDNLTREDLEEILKERLNDLPDNDHPRDH